MMKIYFSGSIAGGREKKKEYESLINFCKKYGEVLSEHVGDETALERLDKEKFSDIPEEHIYIRDLKWLDEADIVIADISVPSIGVGYEIGYAELRGKKILCIYDKHATKKASAMITGNRNVIFMEYETLVDAMERCIEPFLCSQR